MTNYFDAYEAVDELIDEVNTEYYESCYDIIYEEICRRVNEGELSLDDAEILNEAAAEKYLYTEGIGSKLKHLGGAVSKAAKNIPYDKIEHGVRQAGKTAGKLLQPVADEYKNNEEYRDTVHRTAQNINNKTGGKVQRAASGVSRTFGLAGQMSHNMGGQLRSQADGFDTAGNAYDKIASKSGKVASALQGKK